MYCMDRVNNRVYVRRYSYPRITEHNLRLGSICKNIFMLQPSTAYIEDMKSYLYRYRALRYGANKQIRSWSILFTKLLRDMAKQDSIIDLLTITREEISVRDLPCISIKKAVEAGLLPEVYHYTDYTHEL